MRIAILAEANTANQSGLETDGTEITTAQAAGELYGYGSPIYHIMRILRPISGGGIGGSPSEMIIMCRLAALLFNRPVSPIFIVLVNSGISPI
jgi:hypothetical protein